MPRPRKQVSTENQKEYPTKTKFGERAELPKQPMRPLNHREQLFVSFYVQHWQKARAAREAGYSAKSAAVIGYSLTHRVKPVMAAIDKILRKHKMSANEVLARLSQQAAATIEPFMAPDGSVDLTTQDAQDNLHLIKKLKVKNKSYGKDDNITTEQETEIEIHDAHSALVDVGRHYGLFLDKSAEGDQVYREHMDKFVKAIRGDGAEIEDDNSDDVDSLEELEITE